MALLGGKKKRKAKKRLERLEKQLGRKIDLKVLEKQVGGKIDLKELEKRLDLRNLEKKVDLKELEKRLPGHREPEPSSAAGFLAGLLLGAVIGAVLAIVLGKGGNREVMDQFTQRAEELKDTAAEKYHQVRGDAEEQAGGVATQFDDEVAIEREVNGSDLVDSATDTIDSASEDVHQAIDEVQQAGDEAVEDAQRRLDQA